MRRRASSDAGFGRTVTWDRPLLEGYRYRLLPSASRTDISGKFIKNPNWDVVRDVMFGRHDVAWVHGYAHLTTWLAAAAALARDAPPDPRRADAAARTSAAQTRAEGSGAAGAFGSSGGGHIHRREQQRYFRHYGMPRSGCTRRGTASTTSSSARRRPSLRRGAANCARRPASPTTRWWCCSRASSSKRSSADARRGVRARGRAAVLVADHALTGRCEATSRAIADCTRQACGLPAS
jgi:hypothetical protein